jgi:hypothetical protein
MEGSQQATRMLKGNMDELLMNRSKTKFVPRLAE